MCLNQDSVCPDKYGHLLNECHYLPPFVTCLLPLPFVCSFCRLTMAVSYLQGPAGQREEETGGYREGEGADGAGETGAHDEAVPGRGENQEGRERSVWGRERQKNLWAVQGLPIRH